MFASVLFCFVFGLLYLLFYPSSGLKQEDAVDSGNDSSGDDGDDNSVGGYRGYTNDELVQELTRLANEMEASKPKGKEQISKMQLLYKKLWMHFS